MIEELSNHCKACGGPCKKLARFAAGARAADPKGAETYLEEYIREAVHEEKEYFHTHTNLLEDFRIFVSVLSETDK